MKGSATRCGFGCSGKRSTATKILRSTGTDACCSLKHLQLRKFAWSYGSGARFTFRFQRSPAFKFGENRVQHDHLI